ncbi:hypothetical protein [Baekduia sp. Peel2402]|uniref:hypothetical protein n=1 Tax=Baekduia sp. Peel2402 TaxID=3458296 RepID=UPI00403EED1C
MIKRLVLVSALAGLMCLQVGSAQADFHFESVGVQLTGADQNFSRQAGGHPDLTFSFAAAYDANAVIGGEPSPGPAEAAHAIDLDLPPGLVGNPVGLATCDPVDLGIPARGGAKCPPASQIGIARVVTQGAGTESHKVGIYNIAHGPDVPARFGFNVLNVVNLVDARVRPGDYGISSGSLALSQAEAVVSAKITFWGVPADPSHDGDRQKLTETEIPGPFDGPRPDPFSTEVTRAPFLSSPTSCSTAPVAFTARGDSWEHIGAFDTRSLTTEPDGTPFAFDGCERLPFRPSIDVLPLSQAADAPTGLNVDLKVPQASDPDGFATAHVRRVVMRFPQGMSVSPSSAAGLGACAPAEIGLGTNAAPACPNASKLGKVTIDTPLLPDPLTGDVILAKQNDNPFRSLLALYIAVKGPGFYVKLPGKIDLDQITGQLTATFDNTPQLPFSRMLVEFPGGSQAALATPTTCGTYNTHVDITSWASNTPVALDSPMTINQDCAAKAFAPSFTAGTTNPIAGQYSPFVFTLTRSDGMPFLQRVETSLPKGMLADISKVPQCDPGPANAGFCPAASRIGTVAAQSGPGGQPLSLTGGVYLTGPYKDAPFGLSIAVPTAGQAGPFDLGVVTVRAGLYVDRKDAHVTVKSDPLPTIIQGIPLRLRQVRITIDREKFLFNPTSCEKQSIFGSFGALGGATSDQKFAFQPGGCKALDLRETFKFKLRGSRSTKDGTSPSLEAAVTQAPGGTNLAKVEAKLPLALVLEPKNAQALCKPEQAAKFSCPKTSIVGSVTARSVLPHDLKGPVYFVEGRRVTKTGRVVSTLPNLWIPLSGDGVTIDLNAKSQVDSIDRLVTTFSEIPDAPIKSVNLKINGGKHGILVVAGKSTCKRDMTFDLRITGQNGDVETKTAKPTIDGCKKAKKAAAKKR